MELRNLSNHQLFAMYEADLILRIRNKKNLKNILNLLNRFKDFLGSYPPSEQLAKGFLAKFTSLKPHTWYNYVGEIKRFMSWYGEGINLKVKLPKSLPTYHEDRDIEALFAVIQCKKTHKKMIPRDLLLVELDWRTGLRRSELSNLEVRDIHNDLLIVRNGKGKKDRVIPLSPTMAEKLHNFTKGMKPNEKVFKLKAPCISMKIKQFARKAGLEEFHTHTMRHKFATDLVERGVDIKTVQELMGHENISTTQVYLAITNQRLRDAVDMLDYPRGKKKEDPNNDSSAWVQPVVY